tara:strand:- start:625 stop:837 length:213 start_codon:yes stop_codon:yes gene_type:complete
MPTLDDSPILEALSAAELDQSVAGTATAIATQDLILIYDQSQQKIKTITIADFFTSISDATALVATTGTE